MKVILLSLCLLTSCTTSIKSPVTQIEYTGTIDARGITITAMPPFWIYACQLWKLISSPSK